jgi:SRSO17 transposase
MPMNLLSGGNPMTEQEIAELGPAFATELARYSSCFLQKRTAKHFGSYCRGLLSDLPRKSVEPIALAAGTAVRTLQEFLTTSAWDHEQARNILQQRLVAFVAEQTGDPLGTIGVIDETSAIKKGDQTPGVQRQYLGCVGKIDNGIVTVHVSVARGTFQALLDADLYLPRSWAQDRKRCQESGIPDDLRYRSKWRIALDQLIRLHENGMRFDWLVFDEGYGSKVPFLWLLGLLGQKFVAEVPVNFMVREQPDGSAVRADRHQPGSNVTGWHRFHIARKTLVDQVWRARRVRVWAARRWQSLITAVNETTGEVKFFVTNAVDERLERILAVAFRRATIEHNFRLAKGEAGMTHFEGRDYTGLMRHLIQTLIVMGFVAVHTERLRGEKSGGDSGTSLSSFEHSVCCNAASSTGSSRDSAHESSNPISSVA